MQLCWDYKLTKEARELGLKILGQLSFFLMNLKLESSIRPNMKHENLIQDCVRMVCIVAGIWFPILDLHRNHIDQIEDSFQTVRDLTRTNSSIEDNFRSSLLGSLSQLSSKVAQLRDEKKNFEDIILMPYQYRALEIEVEINKKRKDVIVDSTGTGEIVNRLRSLGHFLKDIKSIQEEKEKVYEASREKHNEHTEKDVTIYEIPAKVESPKIELGAKERKKKETADFGFYLESFVKLGKKRTKTKAQGDKELEVNQTQMPRTRPKKKADKCGGVLDMDGYFNHTIQGRMPARPIPANLHLPVYNKTYTNEKWYWISNLRGKNINVNSAVMMKKVGSLDTIVCSDYEHMNMTIKVLTR